MGGDQDRDPLLGGDPRQQGDDLVPAAQVEVRERLVQQQERRPRDQRVGDQHALLLAAREAAHPAVGEAARVDGLEHLVDPRCARARGQRDAVAVCVDAETDEVAGPQRRVGVEQELLRYVADQRVAARASAPGDQHAAAAGRLEAEDDAEQRRLAGAVGADQPGELAGLDRETDLAAARRGRPG